MMSAQPEWNRKDNRGARETAEIEFVIDLQLHALEGGRVMETKIGVLQTADWVSNRHLIYPYHRGSGEPFWFNRSYEHLRKRVKQAVEASKQHDHFLPVFNEIDEEGIRACPQQNLIDGRLYSDVNSAGSTLLQRCHQVKKKSLNNNDEQISDLMRKRLFEAYDYAAKGLSITSLAQIERLAAVRLPDVGMMKDDRDDHYPDGRVAMVWKDGHREIYLNKDCLISFQFSG